MAFKELKRKKAHRESLLRNVVTSVILYDRVTTTQAKAKEARRLIDRVITLGKDDRLSARRQLLAWLTDAKAAKKIWEVLRPRYESRTSGFTRWHRLSGRKGDNAERIIIELIGTQAAVAETSDKVEAVTTETSRRLPRLGRPRATVTVRRKTGAKK